MILAETADFRAAAKRKLPHFLFEYLDGGSFGQQTLHDNEADLRQLNLVQRVLANVGEVSTHTEIFGSACTLPLVLAPVGIAGLYARRGEVQVARAANGFGVPFTLSTVSACSIEEVREDSGQPCWFQLYTIRDRGFRHDMLARARATGTETLVFTVDMPVPGIRYRDMRSGLSGGGLLARKLRRLAQAMAKPGWAIDVGLLGRPHTLGNVAPVIGPGANLDAFWAWLGENFDPSISWADLESIRADWPGKLVVKGIMTPADAHRAVAAGVDGIVVSNHGGRQLDGAPSTISVLPSIREAVGGAATLFMDSGIRSGNDILRAVASGADAVLIGRAWVYALATGGEAGVRALLEILQKELTVSMALTGCRSIADINEKILIRRH